MTKRKIAIICSSRATYGYKRKIIRLMHDSDDMEPQIIVTGSHLLKKYGHTIEEIEADNFPISARIDMMIDGDSPCSFAKSLGVEIQSLAQVYSMLLPDIVLVTGDRGEMFAAAFCAVYMNIPVAHIQSGDRSGHIDGSARHAMTKLAHIHFPSCEDSADRVLRMGEEGWRVYNVGAPQLDAILGNPPLPRDEVSRKLGIDLNVPTLLVIQHAVLIEAENAYSQMLETMEAVKELGIQTLCIYPNIDSGGAEIINAIDEYKDLPFIHCAANLERRFFISLLHYVTVLLGNSSCGILEASSFKLPVVNIGNRQRDRMQADNVINVGHHRKEIAGAVDRIFNDTEFKDAVQKCQNPYGDGHSSERIVDILRTVEIEDRLIDKLITY